MATKHVFTVEMVFNNGTPGGFEPESICQAIYDKLTCSFLFEEPNAMAVNHHEAGCEPAGDS